jgi:hypothetical protein
MRDLWTGAAPGFTNARQCWVLASVGRSAYLLTLAHLGRRLVSAGRLEGSARATTYRKASGVVRGAFSWPAPPTNASVGPIYPATISQRYPVQIAPHNLLD